MLIAYTSDLHAEKNGNKRLFPFIADRVMGLNPDCFVLCGDVSPDLHQLEEVLLLFSELSCPKLFVAGNHDIWRINGSGSSWDKYDLQIPAACSAAGFIDLTRKGFCFDGVFFAGTIGWFDYSLRNRELDDTISLDNYRSGRYANLRWNDAVFTDWCDTFAEDTVVSVCERHLSSLSRQFDCAAELEVSRIIAVSHVLPREEILNYSFNPGYDFSCGFMGANAFGELLKGYDKVSHWLFGHIHRKASNEWNGVKMLANPLGYLAGASASEKDIAREAVGVLKI